MHRLSLTLAALVTLVISQTGTAVAGADDRARDLVYDAAKTIDDFIGDNGYNDLWEKAPEAKALVIVPAMHRGGFFFGASGGNGILIERNGAGWSEPSFMRLSAVSFGFQAGIEKAEIVLVVFTEAGVNQLLNSDLKLGADASISVGPVGGGGKVQTTDVLAFSRSEGLFGAVSVEGIVIKTHRKWNKAYYGREVTPTDILKRRTVSNPASASVKQAANRLIAKGRE